MSIIANSSVDKVKFDSTIECTIIDDTDKLIGKYKVKNESYAEFYAYSQITTYNKDDKVYVQIPKGDYNSTKFIVGKKTDKNEDKPYNFVNPFNTFIDLTGNFFVARDNNKEVWSILANGSEEEIEITPEGGITFTDEQQGFTRLGLRADFRAWLETLGVVSGNYGLRLEIYGIKDDTAENIKEIEKNIEKDGAPLIASIELDTNDMYGNPYNFEGYYSQEIVVDTSAVAKIYNIKIFLYQKGNFKDSNNSLISYTNDFNMSVPPNNIFVKDIYMGLGISADEIENEYVRVYSLDGSTYVIDDKGQIDSKTVRLKWIHFDEDGNRVQITEHTKDDTFEVRWYIYEFGAPSADEYSGVYWTAIEDNTNNFYYQLKPRSNKNQEQVKVVILYNGKVYRSNVIIFNNEKQVPNDATIDSLNALSIYCEDQANGNYLIYNQANYLMNRSDGKISRKLTLHFDSKTYAITDGIIGKNGGDISKLVEAQKVTWQIPIKNTMLNFGIEDTENENATYKEIVIDLTNENDETPSGEFSLDYTINTFYSANKSNNTVIAKVEKDGIVYTAIKDFTFGQAGTNGTDCTLVIDMVAHESLDNKVFTAIKSGVRDNYTFKAQLYDNEGKEVTNFNNCKWAWEFMDGSTVNNVSLNNENEQSCKLSVNTTNSIMNNLIILQVTLSGWGDYDLTAYYPVPITTLDNAYINGPTEVIYLSNGEPTFSKEPYRLFVNGEEIDENVIWNTYSNDSSDEFIGQIKYNEKKKEYRLSPMNFYVDGVSVYGVQGGRNSTVVWSQPILVIQNKYPSAMVNKWDGQLSIDNSNNFIGVAQIAAGKKENNNTFTGVLMGSFGDGKADSSLSKNTGVYGYYKGDQVYALKDDGTASFGKSGNGRITINGSTSQIKSEGYDSGNGLLIDLKESKIDGKSNNYSAFLLNKSSPYLTIKDPASNTTLMNVGSDGYYLKSKNYTTDNATGMYINLNDGSIIANTGTFKDSININYTGSTGSYWTSGTHTLNEILNEIGTTASEAKRIAKESKGWVKDIAKAQSKADEAFDDAADALSLLLQCFGVSPDGNKTVAQIVGRRASITLGDGFTVSGDQADFTDCSSVALGRAGTIYISTTSEGDKDLYSYIVDIVKAYIP